MIEDKNGYLHCGRCGAFISGKMTKRWIEYACTNCDMEGKHWFSGYAKWKCDDCACCVKIGENWVPYGDTMVKEGDDYDCSAGYDAGTGDCPDDAWIPDELRSVAAMVRS